MSQQSNEVLRVQVDENVARANKYIQRVACALFRDNYKLTYVATPRNSTVSSIYVKDY